MKSKIDGRIMKKSRDPKVVIDFSIRFFPWWLVPAIGTTLMVGIVILKALTSIF